jgi:hypothetical protein
LNYVHFKVNTIYCICVHKYSTVDARTCMAVLIPQITQRPLSAASLETYIYIVYTGSEELYNVCQPDPTSACQETCLPDRTYVYTWTCTCQEQGLPSWLYLCLLAKNNACYRGSTCVYLSVPTVLVSDAFFHHGPACICQGSSLPG